MIVAVQQIVSGNRWLIVCCVFYVAWWLLAFRPEHPLTGLRTGWLLIPAFGAGVAGVVMIIRAGVQAPIADGLLPTGPLVVIGLLAYVVLAMVTRLGFDRPVTTELVLIVGWTVLALYEVSTLVGAEAFSHRTAVILTAVILLVAVISVVCYTVYYRLDARAGWLVGAVPLVLVAVTMGAISGAVQLAIPR